VNILAQLQKPPENTSAPPVWVTASFAMLGDVILAEPKAMIGFAGPRVITNTLRMKLPEGFQTAEFLLERGFVNRIVNGTDMRHEIQRVIDFCGR